VATSVDVGVIGGGVIGLAIARALALSGREVVVFEAERALGLHTSSRNSEVVHAGFNYEPGSLKAALCVQGRQALYAYCDESYVPYALPGKLVVATHDTQIAELERLKKQAEANGVFDLVWLDQAGVRALEPEVFAVRALWSPSTGIVDSRALMASLQREAVEHGARVVLDAPVLGGRADDGGFTLELGGAERSLVRCRAAVNAAGLRAPSVSRSLAGVPASGIPAEHFAKGHYFVLGAPSPFRRLVYPIPVVGGLGVHVTLDLAGQVRFGPDATWVDGVEYEFDERRAPSFYAAIRAYYPALADGSLLPGYTGIRPKLGPAGTTHDFVIQGPDATGVRGFAALYGIESPGLTASLAIAARVRDSLALGG